MGWVGKGSVMGFAGFELGSSALAVSAIVSYPMPASDRKSRWNSVIFEEIAANNYVTFLMTEGFVHGPVGNFDSPAKIGTGYPTELLRMQSNITALKNMTNEECIQTYTSSPYIADYGNVVLITHDTNDTH